MKHYLINANHKFKYLFFRIPKNANSTLIGRNCKTDLLNSLATDFVTENNLISDDKYKSLFDNKFKNYLKVVVCRNPYDRIVSCWRNKSVDNSLSNWPNSVFHKCIGSSFKEFVKMFDQGVFIENKVQGILREKKSKKCYFLSSDRHLLPQVNFFPNNIDYIARQENLQEDFNTLCDKLKMPLHQLSHVNKQKTDPDTKSNKKHYSEYYDDETRDIVTKHYLKDIEYFGYKFGK